MDQDPLDRGDVLGESESTLRQVSSALSHLFDGTESEMSADHDDDAPQAAIPQPPADLSELLSSISRAYGEIVAVISSLRQSRGILEQAAMDRLKNTNDKLKEVSSATEMATTGILDGVDRALGMVTTLEDLADDSGRGDSREVRRKLQEELHGIMTLLQFQDITAQQLGYASGVLTDIESRLLSIAEVFESSGLWCAPEGGATAPVAGDGEEHLPDDCDPDASHFDGEGRQALADEIFTTPGA